MRLLGTLWNDAHANCYDAVSRDGAQRGTEWRHNCREPYGHSLPSGTGYAPDPHIQKSMNLAHVHSDELPAAVKQEIIGIIRRLLERQIDFT